MLYPSHPAEEGAVWSEALRVSLASNDDSVRIAWHSRLTSLHIDAPEERGPSLDESASASPRDRE
jgi:hypothetical protein